jgi:hypothetical protein
LYIGTVCGIFANFIILVTGLSKQNHNHHFHKVNIAVPIIVVTALSIVYMIPTMQWNIDYMGYQGGVLCIYDDYTCSFWILRFWIAFVGQIIAVLVYISLMVTIKRDQLHNTLIENTYGAVQAHTADFHHQVPIDHGAHHVPVPQHLNAGHPMAQPISINNNGH